MKNILFLETASVVGNAGIGGSLRSLLQIVKGLNKNEYRPTVLLYHNFDIIDEYRKNNCKVIVAELGNNQNLIKRGDNKNNSYINKCLRTFKFLKKIKRNFVILKKWKRIKHIYKIIKENDIDILHCNNRISTTLEGIVASKLAKIPCIVHQRDFNYDLPFVTKFIARKVNRFIAISYAIQQNLINENGVSPIKIEVIHNWINVEETELTAPEKMYNKSFSILWIGRIIPWKGTHLLVEIANKLRETHKDFEIDIIGSYYKNSPEYFNSIRNRVDAYNLNDRINFKGYVNYNEIYKKKYDVFLHTSVKPEPFGRVIIEAMQHSIPVIATNMGGVLDIVKDGENGFLYDPNKLNEPVNKINRIWNSAHLKNKFVENGLLTIKNKFSSKDKIEKIQDIYGRM
ncbi:glycosyltransferase family 4 protein [candidate division WOR-3 bacterium]|nr:glycosyltransferase family 4 protein [candidate division WOR-3 bacterium]